MNDMFFKSKRFDIVKAWCAANGIVPQISKLRVSKKLMAGVGRYEFDILQSNNPAFTGEVVLNRNDVFIPFSVGVLLSFDKEAAPTGKAPLLSYAPKAGVQNEYGFMTRDIEALYNGVLTQYVDQTLIQQSFPAELFKHVPQNVPAVCLNSSDEKVSMGIEPEWNLEKSLHQLVPNIIYQGDMDIRTQIDFNGTGSDFKVAAASAPTTEATDMAAYLNFVMYGVLVKNAAQEAKTQPLSTLRTQYMNA